MAMAQVQVLHDVPQSGIRWRVTLQTCPYQGFLLPRERIAGGMVPKYLVERIKTILRGSPLPARWSEGEQVRERLVRAR